MVLRFNFDERARLGFLVVEADFRRHALAGVGLMKRLPDNLARDERRQVDFLAGQNFFQQVAKFVVLLAVGEIAGAPVIDKKSVEHNASLRVKICAPRMFTGGTERAGNFAEQSGAVPSADLDGTVTAVGFIPPCSHRQQSMIVFGESIGA